MKIGIIYYSKTGITKKLSEIATAQLRATSHEVKLLPIENYNYFAEEKYNLLIIGSFCEPNNYPEKVRGLFSSLKVNKCLASFVTHSTYESGPYYQNWGAGCNAFYERYCDENKVVNKGYFHCRGKPSLAISLFIRMVVIKDKTDWKEYKRDMNNHPDEIEICRFKEFIENVVE